MMSVGKKKAWVKRPTQAGFTVVELLTSLAILALILSFLPGTLRVGQRVWETQEQFSRIGGQTAFYNYVQKRLSGAMPVFSRDQTGRPQIAFEGRATTVRFVSRAGAGPDGAGIYLFEFTSKKSKRDSGRALVLRQRLHISGPNQPARENNEEHLSPGRVSRLSFRYFGRPRVGEVALWQSNWSRNDALPDLIEIGVLTSGPKPVFRRRIVELRLRRR